MTDLQQELMTYGSALGFAGVLLLFAAYVIPRKLLRVVLAIAGLIYGAWGAWILIGVISSIRVAAGAPL